MADSTPATAATSPMPTATAAGRRHLRALVSRRGGCGHRHSDGAPGPQRRVAAHGEGSCRARGAAGHRLPGEVVRRQPRHREGRRAQRWCGSERSGNQHQRGGQRRPGQHPVNALALALALRLATGDASPLPPVAAAALEVDEGEDGEPRAARRHTPRRRWRAWMPDTTLLATGKELAQLPGRESRQRRRSARPTGHCRVGGIGGDHRRHRLRGWRCCRGHREALTCRTTPTGRTTSSWPPDRRGGPSTRSTRSRVRVERYHADLAAEASVLIFAIEEWKERVKALLQTQ